MWLWPILIELELVVEPWSDVAVHPQTRTTTLRGAPSVPGPGTVTFPRLTETYPTPSASTR